ncbi:MAG: flagellar assembly protein FliW [Syntrophales bacterium]
MKIHTTRFGELDIEESRIITMRGGILGFEHLKRFFLYAAGEKNPFWWFQSAEDSSVAFVVIDPFLVKADYTPEICDEDERLLELEKAEDVVVMSIVTIRHDPFGISVNLRAPLVINAAKKLAKQIILDNEEYPVQYAVSAGRTRTEQAATVK